MKKKNVKKYFLIGAIALALFLSFNPALAQSNGSTNPLAPTNPLSSLPAPTSPQVTATPAASTPASQAQTPNLLSCSTNLATCGIFYAAYIANDIGSLFVTLGAFIVRLGLQFNDNIFNSPAVQTGFSVILAIANLGFVLGIIIIALATILRNQTYGIKQLLWKLVVMAILVNFGLVICAPIVGFADSMSNYFVNATSPSAATGGYEGYVTTMTQAFAPQSLSAPAPTPGSSAASVIGCAATGGLSFLCQLAVSVASSLSSSSSVVQMTLSLVFSTTFIALTAFTFLCLGVLLIVRYLILSGLLIVLPLAWLMFVFPKFDSNFSKWWNTFIKWTFFPPLALFFIYLAFITATNISPSSSSGSTTANTTGGSTYLAQAAGLPLNSTNVNGSPEGALVYETGVAGPIQQAADEILLIGLTVMGLMFANSLSGKAGETVVHTATAAGKATGKYLGKKTARVAGDRLRTAGKKYNPETRETTSFAQRVGSKLQGVPGLKRSGAALANYTAPKAVQEDRKEDIKHYIDANLKNLTNDGVKQRANSLTAFANPTVAAAIAQELARRDMTTQIDKKRMGDYVDVAEKMGTSETIFNNRPDLMPSRKVIDPVTKSERDETPEETMARAIGATKGDVINVNAEIFNYTNPKSAVDKLGLDPANAKDVIGSAIQKLTPAQLGTLGSDQSAGSQARQNNITNAVKDMLNMYGLKKMNATTGKYEFDTVALSAQVAAGASKNAIDGLENMEKIVKHMENSGNWGSVLNS